MSTLELDFPNHFLSAETAAAYAAGRPDYQAEALRGIAAQWGTRPRFEFAVDIACGTGLSTRALLKYSRRVVGIDISPAMLAQAVAAGSGSTIARKYGARHLDYLLADAAVLPFGKGAVDILTVCEAFHWIDGATFFPEARRVLRPGGFLLLYGGGITGHMAEDASFFPWFQREFLSRYPSPPRRAAFDPHSESPPGFALRTVDRRDHPIRMERNTFVEYLLSVSNTTVALAKENRSMDDERERLRRDLAPFFPTPRTLAYKSTLWLLASGEGPKG